MIVTYKSRLPFYIIPVTVATMIIYPAIWMLIWKKWSWTFWSYFIKINKLIETIKHILQIFPEGVIIRSHRDNNKKATTNFANHSVQKDFEINEADLTDLNRDNLQIFVAREQEDDKDNQQEHINCYFLEELLELWESDDKIGMISEQS